MKKKNKKTWIIISIVAALIVCALIATLYMTSSKNGYTYGEKKWMTSNAKTVVNIAVGDDIPLFSDNGTGVFYDYIKALENDTELSFNVSKDASSEFVFDTKKSITNRDLIFFKDHYVVISKDEIVISKVEELKTYSMGVLSNDLSSVTEYLANNSQTGYKSYESIENLTLAFDSGEIVIAVVPLYGYIDTIIENGYHINFHLEGLNDYYTLTLSEKNNNLNSIMAKFLNRYSEKVLEKKNAYLLEYYYDYANYTEIDKEAITNEDIVVGFVNNLPFEGKISKNFTGLTNAYLEAFAELTGATYDYQEYSNIDKLTNALNNKKVDLVLNYYSYSNSNYTDSGVLGTTEYVVLAHNTNEIVVDSLYSLRGNTVTTLDGRNLKTILSSKNIFTIKDYPSVKKLLKHIDKNSIVVIEKEVYDYYKADKLKNYSVRYINEVSLNNKFSLLNDNTALNKAFVFYLNLLGPKEMTIKGTNDALETANSNIIWTFIKNNIVLIVIVIILIAYIVYKITHKIHISKRIKREDKLMYLDVMTNLKNRNYLNDNIPYWEENKVYPQTIIVLDLNRVKELNDQFGHEEGDKQIMAAANVLIKTQRENTEIIRTDGNEFLIYLVGYQEKIITSYIHKLNKEFKSELPYKDYGVAIGYSMINDDVKTIDDAVNDALIMMRENKEETISEEQA